MDSFADSLNAFLNNSQLLVSTLEGELVLGPASAKMYYERYDVLE